MNDGTVWVEHRDGCAWVTLDRPPPNLFTPALIARLTDVFAALRATGRAAQMRAGIYGRMKLP